ncbi:hypothetical protein MUK42_15550 [Musa troglodytarum]|uniref:Uncharacterized protein n=1 Tax=Musa troglodytarum TaxID=320322 RepID=A0A9E7GXB4_9LILI|nr:hypothetical protein MUK42_15550 [Musa troglodytarum]
MENAKRKANNTGNATTTAATTPKKLCLNPKWLLRYSDTSLPFGSSIGVCISPNCEATSPYKVHATGHAQ